MRSTSGSTPGVPSPGSINRRGWSGIKRQVVALAVLQVADLASTCRGLSLGAAEGNPAAAAALGAGPLPVLALKLMAVLVVVALASILWRSRDRHRELNRVQALVALRFSCAGMLALVAWNVWVGWLQP